MSTHVKESKIGFRGFRIPGTGFRTLSVKLGFRFAIVSGILDFLNFVPDSTSKNSQNLDCGF